MNSSGDFLVRGLDELLNHDLYRDNALNARSAYLGELVPAVPKFSPATKRRLSLFAAAFIVATGAFWATMLTDPPTTEARASGSFSIGEVIAKAPRELPVQQADAF